MIGEWDGGSRESRARHPPGRGRGGLRSRGAPPRKTTNDDIDARRWLDIGIVVGSSRLALALGVLTLRRPDAVSEPAQLDSAGRSFSLTTAAGGVASGRDASVLFAGRPEDRSVRVPPVAVERVRTTSVAAVRDELIEEVRVAARWESAAIAAEGACLAGAAGLEARPAVVEADDGPVENIVRVAIEESAAAVVVGRRSRPRVTLRPGGLSDIVDRCLLPVVVI
jgi:nucleotide-binding universal stress UspA family protein